MSQSRRSNSFKAMTAVVAVVLAGPGLAGCGSDSPGSGKQSGSDSPSPSQSTAVPTEPASDWKVAELRGAQFKAPPDWSVGLEAGTYAISSPKLDDGAPAGSGIFGVDTTLAMSTEELAKVTHSGTSGDFTKIERLKDEKFGGTTFFHVRGTGEVQSYDIYGAVLGDIQVTITWSFNTLLVKPDQIAAWINQVMPTFTFKG